MFDDLGMVGTYESGIDTATGTSCMTDENGLCSLQNVLPPGDYCVVETVTPTGYKSAAPQCLALALGHMEDPETVDALLGGVNDPDSETRIYSIWALGAGLFRREPPHATVALLQRTLGHRLGRRRHAL